MKRFLLYLFFFAWVIPLSAQSDALKAAAQAYRDAMIRDGYRILVQKYGDVNENRSITSGKLNFQSGKQYAIVFLLDGRASGKLTLDTGTGRAEIKSHWEYKNNVTQYLTAFDRVYGQGEILGSITGLHWYTAHLIVGVK
ncbi:MAG TPA: hypothetical protein ENN17_06390 [bacterium]|nr:hypothetical protein [bacterium]